MISQANQQQVCFNVLKKYIKHALLQKLIGFLQSGNSKIRIKAINLAKILLEQYLKAFASKIIKKKNSSQNNTSIDQKTSDTVRKSSTASQDREQEDPEYFQNIFKADNPEIQFIDEIQILMIRFQLQITKIPFIQEIQDNKLLFNSLIILDLLFQTIFCGPSIQTELETFIKQHKHDIYQTFFKTNNNDDSTNKINNFQINQSNLQTFQLKSDHQHLDLQNLIINQSTKFIRMSQEFQELRLQEILQIIPLVQSFLHSPWSNIRSLTYGLLCYWVKPNIGNYKASQQKKFANLILDIIESLLINQESECRTGGLNIIGSFCGLGYNFDAYGEKMQEILLFFRQSENIIPTKIWKAVYKIQFDWDSTNQAAALALIQLCAPRIKVKKFYYQQNKSTQNGQNFINQMRRQSKESGSSQTFFKREDSFFSIPNILNKDEENQQFSSKKIYSASLLDQRNNNNENMQENIQKFGKLFTNQQNNGSYCKEIKNNQSYKKQEELLYRDDEDAKMESRFEQQKNQIQKQYDSASYLHNNEDDDDNDKYLELEYLNNIFWVEYLNSKDIRDYISMFRNEYKVNIINCFYFTLKIKQKNSYIYFKIYLKYYKPPSTLWIERVNYNNEEEMQQAFQEQQQAIQLSEDTDLLFIQQNTRNNQIQQQQQKQNQQTGFIQKSNQNHQLGQYIDQDVQFQQAGSLKAYCDIDDQEQNNRSKNNNNNRRYKLDDDQLELDELGIIEANEEDWNEGEENRILMNAHKVQDGIHNIQSGKKEKDIKKPSTKLQINQKKEQVNKNSFNEGNEINKKDEEKSKKQILISDSRQKQQSKQQGQKETQGDKTQLFQNFLGQISPRDIVKMKEHQRNQQTFPTDDDELEEDIINQDLTHQVEQNYDINFGTHEIEQILEDDIYQYNHQQSNHLQNKSTIAQTNLENKKRQSNNLPTIESEEEFVSNQNNLSHETVQYLQSLMLSNSEKANNSKNIDQLSQKSQFDDLMKQKDRSLNKEQNKSTERTDSGRNVQKVNTVKKDDEQIKQEQINYLSDRITQVSKQNNSLSDRIIMSNKQNNQLSESTTQANIDIKQNQKTENEGQQSDQKNEQSSNQNEKVLSINSLLLQSKDKEFIKQKINQDQKQQLLKQGKVNNIIQSQQQFDESKNNGNNNINQIILQQQILLQQQLLLDAQQKTQQQFQTILIDDHDAINKHNKSNDVIQLSENSQKSQKDISKDNNYIQNLENKSDQIYYQSKTFEDNEISSKQQNNQRVDTINSNSSQQSYQLATSSQSNKSQEQQKGYWDNISNQIQSQNKMQVDHPLQFSFQNSNANSLQSSTHPSAQFKKDDDPNNHSQYIQTNPKVFHSFAMQNSIKGDDQNAMANMFFPNESSQFQSAEFERSSDTEIEENHNNFQQVNSARIGKSVNEDDKLDEKVNLENEKSQLQNSIQYVNQNNLFDSQSEQINNQKYFESLLFNDKLIKYNSEDYSKELLLQQMTNFQSKRNPISYTQSSEDQVIFGSNQTLDRQTSKEKSSKINLGESFNSTSKQSGGQSSEGLNDKQKKSLNMIDEVLEESKFTPSNCSGLTPTIKKKVQRKDNDGESNYFREGDSSRNNKKEEGIIEEFLTEEESSTEEQVQVKLKQRYASEPMALQPNNPLSTAQTPQPILIQKSEEYYGKQKGLIKKGTPIAQVQTSQLQQQYQSVQPTTIMISSKNDINDPNLGSTKNTKRSGNKSKEKSNSPKNKKTQAAKRSQLNQINNLQAQQQQILQQQLQQITQNQQLQQYQQQNYSQQQSQQQQSQPQYYASENLTAFQTPLQKCLTPKNRAKEIAFRRNSNSSQQGIGGQSTNGENYTSKKRLNMNENNVNQYMNNSNGKHNKTCESGSNGISGKYYKSIGYKLLTKNHSTNNIFNTSSLINTTQGSTSFNNGSAANLALSQLQNNTSQINQNSAIKINNLSKDKLIKKLMTNKGLNAVELKSVIKLHQQTQLFFNQTQPNQLQQQFSTISGDSKYRTRLSKSPSKNSRLSSYDSGNKNKKRQSKSSSPFNERIELSPVDNREIYPHSLHISYNNQNIQKNSKYSQNSNNYNQNVTHFDSSKNINEVLNSSNRKSKKADYPKNHQTHQNYHIHHPLNPIYWQDEEQQLKQNNQNQLIIEENNEDNDFNINQINSDELLHHHLQIEQHKQNQLGEQFYNNFQREQFINKKDQFSHQKEQFQPNFQRNSLNQQGRSYSSGKIKQTKSKKQRSKEPLMLNENHIGIGSEHFFTTNILKNKDRPNSNEKELSVSLATSTKNNNINLKSKRSLPLNISGFVPSQLKVQPVQSAIAASSINPHQQVEKFLTTTKTDASKNLSKKSKALSKSKSKKEIVILQNTSQHLQQNNTQFTNNTSIGYQSQELLGNKQSKKYEPINLSSQKNKKVKGEQIQNISSQLKILQSSSKQQTSLPSNDSYLPFDNQQQFFKTQNNNNIKNSNFNEFMKNANQNNSKELLDDLNQTL